MAMRVFLLAVSLCFLGATVLHAAATPAPTTLDRQAALAADAVPAGLPVPVKVTWKNTGTKAVEFAPEDLRTVTVQKDGAAARRFTVRTQAMGGPAALSLDAGKSVSRTALLVLGRDADKTGLVPLEWMFPEPGKYTITLDGYTSSAPLVVTVEEPKSDADRAARALWSPELAACLAGDAAKAKDLLPQADKLWREQPSSALAGYALWIRARYAALLPLDRVLFQSAEDACLAILERYPQMASRDEVYELVAQAYRGSFRGPRARETALELAEKYPDSESVARLRKAYGKAFEGMVLGAPETAGTAPIAKATLAMTGLDKIPEGPRAAFDAFWKAAAAGTMAPAEAMLARDFMGEWGSRSSTVRNLWRERQGAPCTQIHIAVTKAEIVPTYTRPSTLPYGQERTWCGRLCVVEASLTAQVTPGEDGSLGLVELPHASWVFYEYPAGTWRLVSEVSTTQHLAAASGGEQIGRDLPKIITTWHLGDGTRDRCPYDEIKKQAGVAGKTADDRTTWKTHTTVMMGPAKDQVLITGQIHMVVRGAAGGDQVVERRVRMLMGLDAKGVLTLKSVTVTDEPPLPDVGPGAPRLPVAPSVK